MKYLILSFLLIISAIGYAQKITGTWNGIIEIPSMPLKFVLHVDQQNGGLTAKADSPMQNVYDIPVDIVRFNDSKLYFEINQLMVNYSGTMSGDSTINGTFTQAGQSFKLNFSQKGFDSFVQPKPQEPVAPFPYHAEDITFHNSEDNIDLAGTFTYPKNGNNFPAVILISGSGQQDRDELILGHKPFLVLANHLTNLGIAVLRFDDRGTGKSTGNFDISTTQDFTKDVKAAINYLKTRKEVKKNNIGLLGHSEGGIVASMVAAAVPESVDFVVLMASPGVAGDEILVSQTEAIAKANGATESMIKSQLEISSKAFEIVKENNKQKKIYSKLESYFKEVAEQKPDFIKANGLNKESYATKQASALSSPWMVYFIKYNPKEALVNVKCPVLVLNGAEDMQVLAKMNTEAIEKALKSSGNKKVKVEVFPHLNHLFQECETCTPAEYGTIQQTVNPLVLNTISTWIRQTTESK